MALPDLVHERLVPGTTLEPFLDLVELAGGLIFNLEYDTKVIGSHDILKYHEKNHKINHNISKQSRHEKTV